MSSTLYFSYQGGWELDESTMEEAASRESLEEAGVLGNIEVISVSLEYCICHRQWSLDWSNITRLAVRVASKSCIRNLQ
jgi:8-oxo-dGTP pyrophosphatase MutT (NUDIX family)